MPKRCLVAICCNQPTVFRKTAQSLMELGWGDRVRYAKDKHGFDEIVHAWYFASPRVDMLRNVAVSQALKDDFSHLVFLDADMIWPTTVLTDLLRHWERDVVAGLYVTKGPPYGPAHLINGQDVDGVRMFHRPNEFGLDLVPVEVVGMGCTIIRAEVLREMGDRDWFAYDADADGWPIVSEDVPFCLKAAKLGFGIWMDPTIECGHVGVQVFDKRFHQRYQASVEDSKERGAMVTVNREAG